MPTYRVYYAEREATDADRSPFRDVRLGTFGQHETRPYKETEWEEAVEARNPVEALTLFFEGHGQDRSRVMWVDEQGESRPIEGLDDYDPDKTYVWVEDGKFMEYQGLDEATPGMVTCPLCGGAGEVEEAVAEEFEAEYEQEGEESWG